MKFLFIISNLFVCFIKFVNATFEKKIIHSLKDNKKIIALAESCTGGLISSRLIDIPGVSEFINVNFVTYSNNAKKLYLFVKEETLLKYGAVSQNCALEMANGLIQQTNCDIALCITGIAGPPTTIYDKNKEPGIVYITVANKDTSKTIKYKSVYSKYYSNSFFLNILVRKMVKFEFSQVAMEELYNFIK